VENLTKRTMEISVPAQMRPLLEATGLTLEQAIESYLADLCQLANRSNGTDERVMARKYFARCYGRGDDARLSLVFNELRSIGYSWLDYGRDRADEFAEVEARRVAELMRELRGEEEANVAAD